MKKSRTRGLLFAFCLILAFWFVLSVIVARPVLPRPDKAIAFLAGRGGASLLPHLAVSLGRVAAGLGLSLLVGVPLGLAMGFSSKTDRLLSPLIYLTYPVPKIALLPVVMLLFGLGEGSKVVMIMMIVVFQVIVASRDSVREIDPEVIRTLRSIGAGRGQILVHAALPATAPKLLTAIRIGIGTSLSILFFTETYGTEYGMGFFVMDAWLRMSYVELYAGILALSITGFILFLCLDLLGTRLCPWVETPDF
jgi:NitT/TauT family transport system permease protein